MKLESSFGKLTNSLNLFTLKKARAESPFLTRENLEFKTIWRVVLAAIVILVPPIIFEKYTFFLYTSGNPAFFNYSGSRLWFDILWFVVGGVISIVIVGREKKASILPSLISSILFIIAVNLPPFCDVKECYVSSTDGLAPLRDFLLFGSLGVITSASLLKKWYKGGAGYRRREDVAFQLGVVILMGFALSFFPIMHIFAGVSVPNPLNYLQWFLAAAPASLAGSMLILDRSNISGRLGILSSGISGVLFTLVLAVELSCENCSGYPVAITSIIFLAVLFTIPALLLGRAARIRRKSPIPVRRIVRRAPSIVASASIMIAIIMMLAFYFASNYQVSVVNGFSGVTNSSFSSLEVGRSFVYSAGYLAIPRVTSKAVGVNVSFGNTSIDQSKFPNDFLAAGIGDQSPNCCKDGLDLAYRADVVQFTNGTEAVLARAWWACDVNMACGGYTWQQLLHLGLKDIPMGTLSNWVELEMNWTSSTSIQWFYRINYVSNHSSTPWMLFSSFTPPSIQNHYWDAGLFYVGTGNQPTGYAYFYQFGISSAYPITDENWHFFVQCPEIILNGSWTCLPKAAYISGSHSFWKVLYTFGENYPGTNFTYLGNHEVEFFYSGSEKSPSDGTPIW
ncbi:MAG TPA: hypothetical protein VN739_06375 [Nitrososphaerales archaeon]|nr:hypothetical protein [Nitrososphaerales archaeon]